MGTILWQKKIGPIGNRYDIVNDLIALPNGGYAYSGVANDGPFSFYKDVFIGISTTAGGPISLYKNLQFGGIGTQNGMLAKITQHTNSSIGYAVGMNTNGVFPVFTHFGTLPFSGPSCKIAVIENGSANYQFPAEVFTLTSIPSCIQVASPPVEQPLIAYSLPICNTGCIVSASPSFTYTTSQDTIFFVNSSINATSYLWNFGVIDTSTSLNPYFIVPSNGTYNICLTAYDSCGSNTICQNITVCNPANANFSWSQSGNSISFSPQNTNALWYYWDFGDFQTSTSQNPSHQYALVGSYNVCLVIGDVCGQDTFCQIVQVCGPVNSNFVSSQQGNSVVFNNLSSNAIGFQWDFGDAQTSSLPNPSHQYAQPGTYNVCLIASSLCSQDTFCRSIQVCAPVNASYAWSQLGDSINFSNASSNAIAYHWDFGDAQTSTAQSPSHQYALSGTYNVCLIAISPCSQDTFCQSIQVCAPANANFSWNQVGDSIVFNNSSSNGSSYFWDFGNAQTSSSAHPSHQYTQQGIYSVCLIVSSSCSQDTFCQTVTFCVPAVANFSFTNSGLTYQFTNQSNHDSTWSWHWIFGDGSVDSVASPTHTYNSATTLTACLIATNACGSDTLCQQITLVGNDASNLQSAFQIHPNPANDQAWIVFNSASPSARQINILDVQGRLIATYEVAAIPDIAKLRLELAEFPKGLYFVAVQSEEKYQVKKLVIE